MDLKDTSKLSVHPATVVYKYHRQPNMCPFYCSKEVHSNSIEQSIIDSTAEFYYHAGSFPVAECRAGSSRRQYWYCEWGIVPSISQHGIFHVITPALYFVCTCSRMMKLWQLSKRTHTPHVLVYRATITSLAKFHLAAYMCYNYLYHFLFQFRNSYILHIPYRAGSVVR